MTRRFGPTLGAGTVIVEQDAGKTIEPAPTGVTAYVGITEKGNPLELIPAPNQREFQKRVGAYLDGTELPNAAFDLYNLSNGAASLWVIRVTDGNEISALDHIFDRHTGEAEYPDRFGGDNAKRNLLTATLKNGGRWGGAERVLAFDYTIVSDLTETTADTGVAMLVDEFKGATLRLFGVSARTYEVVSNDVAGVLTVKSDATMATDLSTGGDSANNEAVVFLDAVIRDINVLNQRIGDRTAVSLVWKDGEEDQVSLFGLDILEDGRTVKQYSNLSLDPANKWYIGNVVNNDPSNVWVTFTVNFTGTLDSTTRPANWSSSYKAFSGATLTAEVLQTISVTSVNADPGFVTDTVFPSPNKVVRQRLILTFSDATNYVVTNDPVYGMESENLGAGVVGTPFAPPNEFTPGFTVKDSVDTFSATDVITLQVDPFPVELSTGDGVLDGSVFVNEGVDTVKVGIENNAPHQITFINNPDVAPTPDSDIETDNTRISSTGVITFPTTAPGAISVVTDVHGEVTVTPTGAPHGDIAALVVDYDAAGVIAGLPVGFFSSSVADILDIGGTAYVSPNTGKANFIRNVLASAELNITVDDVITGTVGDRFRVEARRELRDGYDGETPTDAQFIAALNTVTSPLNALRGKNQGLVKVSMPGITTTTIQKQGLTYAESRNYQYRVEVPASILSEPDAVNYINNTIGRNDFGKTIWPSYHNVVNPLGNGTILQTVTGMVHGREAKVAKAFGGYHKAAAGTSVTLPGIVESTLPEEFVIDEEVTNPQGLNIVKKVKGNFIIWGDRTISLDPAWKFAHQREQMSHYENILFENFDFIIFAINDEIEQQRLLPTFQAFFLPEWQKRALRGKTFEEAATFKIDDENNTDLTRKGGDLNAEISLKLADVVERFIITIGKKGLFEQVA